MTADPSGDRQAVSKSADAPGQVVARTGGDNSVNASYSYGFTPSTRVRILRGVAKVFVNIFRLNSNSPLSTEICQLIQPKSVVKFKNETILFRSGHGRLKWRAETFHTEEPLMLDWLTTFGSSDIFLDVGANVGTYSVPAALASKLVIAVELDPSNLYCLYSNVHYNNVHNNVIIIPFAVGTSKQVIEVHYRDFSLGDALQSVGRPQVLPTKNPSPHVLNQLCIPIDTLFSDYNLPQPTKIKIDVDGNELLVVEGAWRTISGAEEIYFEDNGLDEDVYILNRLASLNFEIIRETPSLVDSRKSEKARNLLLRKTHLSK